MTAELKPSSLSGEIFAVPSKSELHRLLICAAFSDADCTIFLNGLAQDDLSEDILTTIDCLCKLGAKIDITYNDEINQTVLAVTPIVEVPENPVLYCKDSGSTLRFLLPVAVSVCDSVTFLGSEQLSRRPIDDLVKALEVHGVSFSDNHLPLTTSGKLQPGTYEISGDISSQYATGLLLAAPLSSEPSIIKLTTSLLSKGYIDLTTQVMKSFGITVIPLSETKDNDEVVGFTVIKNITEKYRYKSPSSILCEGDWSNAAFFFVANALGADITVNGLKFNSLQRDKQILEFLSLYTADIENSQDESARKSYEIDLSNTPDLLPALAVFAAFADAPTRFVGAARLKLKESNRLESVKTMIDDLGGRAEYLEDGVIIYPQPLVGGHIDSFDDHRIVMAASIACVRAELPIIIDRSEAVRKSYPSFFEDLKKLGGIADVN